MLLSAPVPPHFKDSWRTLSNEEFVKSEVSLRTKFYGMYYKIFKNTVRTIFEPTTLLAVEHGPEHFDMAYFGNPLPPAKVSVRNFGILGGAWYLLTFPSFFIFMLMCGIVAQRKAKGPIFHPAWKILLAHHGGCWCVFFFFFSPCWTHYSQ
jgi:hypothetical protein